MDAARWVEHSMDEPRRPDDGIEADRSRRTEDVYEIDEAVRLEDVIGGRVLGWIGGLALLVGLVYFLVIATSRGWIGEEARVLMAAAVSLVLLGGGAWLHERRGRNEAALAAAATSVAGLFAAIVVAGPVYDLLPALAALPLALAAGALAFSMRQDDLRIHRELRRRRQSR